MLAEFKDLVVKTKIRIDEAAWKQDLAFIRAMIRYEIDLDLFGVENARKNLSKADPQLQFAMTLFPEAEALMRLSGPAPERRASR
jgi:carboxyl-terminal processing protease